MIKFILILLETGNTNDWRASSNYGGVSELCVNPLKGSRSYALNSSSLVSWKFHFIKNQLS